MENSYFAFKDGKYSQMSDFYKLKIVSFHGTTMDDAMAKVLFKSPSLKQELEEKLDITLDDEAELHDKPNMEIEIFNPEFYELKIIKR
jgi:hypothetical protein